MRKLLWVVFAAGLLAGCKKQEPAAPARDEGAVAQPAEAPEPPADEELAQDKPFVLTPEKLAAYVGYQRKVMESYAVMARQLTTVRSQILEDSAKGAAAAEAMKAVESKAELESRARKEAGLSEDDVNQLGNLVMDVITQRHMASMLNLSGELKKLEEMKARLKPEQAKELVPQIDALRARVLDMEKLSSVRRDHGDANVDLVLTREAELMANYQDMLRSFGGKSQ